MAIGLPIKRLFVEFIPKIAFLGLQRLFFIPLELNSTILKSHVQNITTSSSKRT
ncbi:hypothetical protein GGQ60_004612 [Pedobacter zeae]|uniref:Uncharacterized protein n=1 Tax=Pedobacter zeae TaxID=1737356 RepID=A0A7W6P7T5_9SPHI|nr:hypothetical protein [Pedobacter zeae]